MNPLTIVKRIQKLNATEAVLGVSDDASWHSKYKDSAYVFVGGIPFDLTEGDLLAVFAQYGEVVDVNLVRDKETGKSRGFAFLAYEDQRSTILAVDNLNGAKVLGRIIRVDHVSNYKRKEEEDEETEREMREARGVCLAFQRGECKRGSACKFSHNEERHANTGWGMKDADSRWGHDKFEGGNRYRNVSHDEAMEDETKHQGTKPKGVERDRDMKDRRKGAGERSDVDLQEKEKRHRDGEASGRQRWRGGWAGEADGQGDEKRSSRGEKDSSSLGRKGNDWRGEDKKHSREDKDSFGRHARDEGRGRSSWR